MSLRRFDAPPRLTRPRPAPDAEARVLPLINIVFLLLIFFMVAGTLSASDPFDVAPAASARAPAVAPEGAEVLLGRDGRLALDSREMSEAALLDQIARRVAAAPGLTLRLRADGAVPAVDLVALMGRLRAAGLAEITLVTLPDRS